MTIVSRGIRNAFRNYIRTFSIIIIIGLSIGLGLTMLVARQAISSKINSINASVGTTIKISPAGVRGFSGGGNPLSQSQINGLLHINHVESINEGLSDRLKSSSTNLVSPINAGSLGKRFAQNGGGFQASFANPNFSFTPPVIVIAQSNPTNLANTTGGGTFKLISGSVFTNNSTSNVALIGTNLASKNNLKVGSTFMAYNTSITVTGIFDGGNTFTNSELIMPLTTLQNLSSQQGNLTSAVVTIDNLSNVASVTKTIVAKLGSSADVTIAQQSAQNQITPLNNTKTIALYSLIGAIIAGAIIILLTMIMIVRERRREIGVLKAIGASDLTVMFQFMIESLTLTILGSVIGIIIGFSAATPITKFLVSNNSSTATSQAAFRFGGFRFNRQFNNRGLGGIKNAVNNIHAIVGYSIIIDGILAALIISLIGSGLASFFISNIRPGEVMRTD